MNNGFDEHDPTLDEMSDHDEAAMPIGVGDFGGAGDFTTTSEAPSAVKRHAGGALLLVVVVAVAGVGLFSMRTLTRASAATDEPTEVERSIEKFLDMIQTGKAGNVRPNKSTDSVLDVLSESYTQRQVSLEDVQRNPFIIFETADAPVKTPQETVDPIIEKRRVRMTQFERARDRLRLTTVLMGSRPLANINNQVLRVGDSLTIESEDVTFTIIAIEASSVELEAEDSDLDVHLPVTLSIRRDR